jgi:hypothetical protein
MEAKRFDAITIRMAGPSRSRRGVLGLAVGAALASVFGHKEADAAACVKDGKTCDPGKRGGGCCSGTCKKRGNSHKCKPAPGALGCTVRKDACRLNSAACPGAADGLCVILDNGSPLCALGAVCSPCETDAACDQAYDKTGGRCIQRCPVCDPDDGTACVFPEPLEIEMSAPANRSGLEFPSNKRGATRGRGRQP